MGKLHDRLKEIGYEGHSLELYLVRLLFLLFADDTGLFEPPDSFITYIIQRTNPDGSDLALHLQKIFEVLNTPKESRLKTIDEQLKNFPYINGRLFEEAIKTADYDRAMRDLVIECCALDWSKISPAIFGAMFQSVMNEKDRHDAGAHYTSEENILKLIHPLFLDSLREEFENIKRLSTVLRKERLTAYHKKLASLKFLDPACGCGNFLVISYRELRLLEIEVIAQLMGKEMAMDILTEIKVNVNQFYGIEIEEFPAQIAQVAMWLTDHQMNMKVSETFGQYYARIPLTTAASIHNTNALTTDWESIVPKNELSYILGNPPFLGARVMNKRQKDEVKNTFENMNNCGNLDYVTCWYKKAARYMKGTNIEAAFVSTNSITQGEQVPVLWRELINKHGIIINFAHHTFKWWNEASGKAQVYCVIVGFAVFDRAEKFIYIYKNAKGEPKKIQAKQINTYLIDAPNIIISKRTTPICKVSEMIFGSMPNDGGNLLLTEEEKLALLKQEPHLKSIIRPFLGAEEFINNTPRFCIWLLDISPLEYHESKEVQRRIEAVKKHRQTSKRAATQKLGCFPTLFGEIRQPSSKYLLIPSSSSEKRKYIPIGFINKKTICSNANLLIPNAALYEFGILSSTMHMAWTRCVCGRLGNGLRYSASIVYNNFPWPSPTEKQKGAIEDAAQKVLDARNENKELPLSIMYNTNMMPSALVKAHQKLDKAVDAAYGRVFDDDSQRVAYLFELYQKLCGEMFVDTKKRGKGRKA